MDTSTPPSAASGTPAPDPSSPSSGGLGAELRESVLLLSFAVVVTVGLTTAAQAALAVLS
jgi:hypothetical protein